MIPAPARSRYRVSDPEGAHAAESLDGSPWTRVVKAGDRLAATCGEPASGLGEA